MSGARSPRSSVSTDALVALFFLAWRGFAAESDAILERDGLGRVHHRILFTVARLPGIRVGDLASTLGISRQALHRPLGDLRERDLVEARTPVDSGRERSLRLTAKGSKLEAKATGPQRAQLEAALGEVGVAGAAGWATVMRALAKSVVSEAPPAVAEAWRAAIGAPAPPNDDPT